MEAYRNSEMFDLEHTIADELFEQTEYPWEILPLIHDFILKIGPTLDKEEFEERAENIWIAKDATVSPLATLKPPVIIGHGTEVRPGAFVRGDALVGDNAVVGNSTELKNVIIFDGAQVPHYNYVGDSILGYKAHMGAGSITSNVKGDKKLVVIHNGDEHVETGRKKVGAMLGDGAEIGCNTVMNPGSVIGRNTQVYPMSMVRGCIPAGSIYKKAGEIAEKRFED